MPRWPQEGRPKDALKPYEKYNPEDLNEAYRICFASPSGQIVLEDLRRSFGDRKSFVPDSNVTAFHEGQRDIYRLILVRISKDQRRQAEPKEE